MKCTYPQCKCPFDMGQDEKCLIGKQKDLPEKFSKVLHENLEDLYATSENVINEG